MKLSSRGILTTSIRTLRIECSLRCFYCASTVISCVRYCQILLVGLAYKPPRCGVSQGCDCCSICAKVPSWLHADTFHTKFEEFLSQLHQKEIFNFTNSETNTNSRPATLPAQQSRPVQTCKSLDSKSMLFALVSEFDRTRVSQSVFARASERL